MPGSRDTRGRSSGQLATINPNAAGLDVGSTFHVVAVPAGRDDQPVRTFRTFSGDLHRLADWLEETGITTVAMESTSVYWDADWDWFGRRSTIVGLPPSAVPNFAKSLI